MPAIEIRYSEIASPVGYTVMAQSVPLQGGECVVEVGPGWIAAGSPRSVIAHEVGHCILYQYGWGWHFRCECLMFDSLNFDGPTEGDRIRLQNIAEHGQPRLMLLPMLAAD
jgi:hypothetical protein